MLLSLQEYAARMAGKWSRARGFIFCWEDVFDSLEKAMDIACMTLANDQSPVIMQANAEHIKNTLETLAAKTAVASTEFPGKKFPPGEWYSFDAESKDDIKLSRLYIRVYYPATKTITPLFSALYELLKDAGQFVYDPELDEGGDLKPLNKEIYARLKREEDYLGITNSALDFFSVSLTPDEILWIYKWFEVEEGVSLEPEGFDYFYPPKEEIEEALNALRLAQAKA